MMTVVSVVVATLVWVPWVVLLRLGLGLVVVGGLVDADRAAAEWRLDKGVRTAGQNVSCDGSANQIVVVLEKILLAILTSGLAEFADLNLHVSVLVDDRSTVFVHDALDSARLDSSS